MSDQQPEQPEQPEPVTGRRRLRAALLRPTRGQVAVAVLLALLSFATVTQMRTAESDDTYAGYREQDLVNVLAGLAEATRRARSEVTRLEETRDELVSDTSNQRAAAEQARQEADTLGILAGLVPVRGPGIRITVTEVTGFVEPDTMLDMIQSLRIAGAEAIQLNGQVRLVAQSAFSQGVGGVEVDGTLLTSPYVIDVIGPTTALSGAMSIVQGGPRVELQAGGADVEITELQELDIESVREPVDPEYAQPGDGQ